MTRTREARPPLLDVPEAVAALRAALLGHYDRERRSLPWRGETDPYRILVSEVMLQQTRVATVERYYEAWLERFPDVATLAEADEGAVLKAWEGLGYYRRARDLQRAARVVRERSDGALPSDYAGLRDLPGVGDYTAGAVASIAFGERVPAPDGNVRRVLSRLFDVTDPKPAWLRGAAADLLDPDRPGDWNQALMELGATVCAPRSPRCSECPLATWCRARAEGTQGMRPGGPARARARRVTYALAVLRDGDRVLLERRPPGGLLGGLWAFPEHEVSAGDEVAEAALALAVEAAALALAAAHGAAPLGRPEPLAAYEHRFTHLLATYRPVVVRVSARDVGGSDVAWVEPGEPITHALPVVQGRIVRDLAGRSAGREPREGEGTEAARAGPS